ncbi:Uncharacterised protein [Chlamydia trachomatis]|nr:Uncharacterised protein [Chlamydia trachomatis]
MSGFNKNLSTFSFEILEFNIEGFKVSLYNLPTLFLKPRIFLSLSPISTKWNTFFFAFSSFTVSTVTVFLIPKFSAPTVLSISFRIEDLAKFKAPFLMKFWCSFNFSTFEAYKNCSSLGSASESSLNSICLMFHRFIFS